MHPEICSWHDTSILSERSRLSNTGYDQFLNIRLLKFHDHLKTVVKLSHKTFFQGLLRLVQGDSLQKRFEEINHWHRWYEVGNYSIHRSIYSYFDQLVTLPPWPSVRHRNPTALSSLNCRQWLSVCFWPIIYSYKFTSFFSAVFDSHQFLCSLIHFGNSFEINHLIIVSLYSLTNQNGDSRSATTHIFTTSRPIINFTVLDIGAVYVSASVP